MQVIVTDIEWDYEGDVEPGLPTEVTLEIVNTDDLDEQGNLIAEALAVDYGYATWGFSWS